MAKNPSDLKDSFTVKGLELSLWHSKCDLEALRMRQQVNSFILLREGIPYV